MLRSLTSVLQRRVLVEPAEAVDSPSALGYNLCVDPHAARWYAQVVLRSAFVRLARLVVDVNIAACLSSCIYNSDL